MNNPQGDPIVVGIGASAGGLESFKLLLSSMPSDTGMAFVMLQHLAPHHESLTPMLLARCTSMPVSEVKDRTNIEVNHVYVLPPNKFLKIVDSMLYLTPTPEVRGVRTTIDVFFYSLADSRKEKAIGIILSGTGTDGGEGCKVIKDKGGLVIVQDPTTTDFNAMPQNAISACLVDYVVPIEKMPDILVNHRLGRGDDIKHVIDDKSYDFGLNEKDTSDLILILNHLKKITKNDFFSYKKPSLKRRIYRRIEENHLKSFSEYYHFLAENPSEVSELHKSLMIRMSCFFRNPQSFKNLIEKIRSTLTSNPETPYRVWIPGCSTGEEAYSMAILLLEECSLANINKKIQIFATDIDEEALEMARKGIYSNKIERNVSPERLEKFFDKEETSYVVKDKIRANVLFIEHNLLRDIPFSKLDLISCRNLFIYLETEIQKELIKLFHFALSKGGYLFLGNSETINREDSLFETVSKKDRIFKRIISSSREIITPTAVTPSLQTPSQVLSFQFSMPQTQRTFYERAKQQLLEEYVPTSILINAKYEVLYFFGSTNRFLKVPEGNPTLNLRSMARGGLAGKIRKALQNLLQSKEESIVDNTYIEENNEARWVEFKVSTLKKTPGQDIFIVTFKEMEKFPPSLILEKGDKDNIFIKNLERELKDARAYLQNTIEDLEESNEELKIYNEEVISINEELQAANEEMETSKEELQSLNEELTVVNSQLQEKIDEQDKTNNDLVNLLRSTDIAILFLDHNLCLKRFTPEALDLFNLRDFDLGRPLKEITMRFVDPHLLQDAQKILKTGGSIEQEVENEEKNWYLRKCRAYNSIEGKTSGVIITFANVTRIKGLQLAAQTNEQRLLEIFNTIPIRIAYVDQNLTYCFGNKFYLEWLGVTLESFIEHSLKSPQSIKIYEVIKPHIKQVLLGKLAKFDNKALMSSGIIHYEEIVLIPHKKEDSGIKGFFILILDVTERQRSAIAFLKAIIDVAPDPMCVQDDHHRMIIVNKAFCEKSGKDEKDLLWRTPLELYSKREANIIIKENNKALEKEYFYGKKHAFPNNKQEIYIVQKIAFQSQNAETYIVSSYQDVTEIYYSKAKLQEVVQKLKLANEELKNFAHICSHDLQEPARTVLSCSKLFAEHFKTVVDEDAQKYLHYILEGSQRMQKMIESTLSYATLGNQANILESVNCETLITRVLEMLKASIEEFKAVITHDTLPTIIGDAFKLSQLFQNLISNALKFRNKRKPKIHIGVNPYKGGYTFFVNDNGIGIDMDFKENLFKLFRRLNPEEYPGTGIGLAICKKIVDSHGGKIWLESKLGKGTTFYFNIPQKKRYLERHNALAE